jgi:hypothetical protein
MDEIRVVVLSHRFDGILSLESGDMQGHQIVAGCGSVRIGGSEDRADRGLRSSRHRRQSQSLNSDNV